MFCTDNSLYRILLGIRLFNSIGSQFYFIRIDNTSFMISFENQSHLGQVFNLRDI